MSNISKINGFLINAESASFAATASFALNGGGGSAFPYTGSALITGSLIITGSLTVSGSTYGIKSSTGHLLTNNTPTVDWGSLALLDTTTNNTSVDWGNRQLKDDASDIRIDWLNNQVIDATSVQSIDWENRLLTDNTANTSVDWVNRYLQDTSSISSVDWQTRQLFDSGGGSVLNWDSGTFNGSITGNAATATSASFASTASFVNPLQQNVSITGSLNISGSITASSANISNLSVTNLTATTSSITYITSSQLNVGTNIITLNTNISPLRFGGIAVADSGSSPIISGSLLFDSVNDQWIFIHQQTAGSPVTSSVLIMGPQTFNNVGNEITITANRLTKGQAGDLGEHITSSNVSDDGTTVSINSNTEVTGSLTVTQGITGSLFGTAATTSFITASNIFGPNGANSVLSSSYALTASFALNGGGAAFPFSGSAIITGSLTIYDSGSANPLLKIQGGAGELFSVYDTFSGSLFSVNNQSGNPILEVTSDNNITFGKPGYQALLTTQETIVTASGQFTVYSIPTASYDGAWFEYVIRSGSNARAGQVMAVWSGSAVNYSETTTTAFGTTAGLSFGVFRVGGNFALTGSATTGGWTMKTIIRSI